MAEKYSFFNAEQNSAGEYDRTYLAEDIAAYFSSFVGTGVYANSADNLKVYPLEGMNLQVRAGKGWINGYYYENDSDLGLTLDNADGAQSRIDSVVLRLDLTNRYIRIFVKKGAYSSSPIAPSLTRNAEVWELQLATIQVDAGAAEITAANITDTRMDSKVCGIVKGVIEQIDTTALFSQYDDEFTTWFESIKGQLSEDAAGNLQGQITDIIEGTIVPDSGISVYIHSKEGTTHNFQGTGPNGRALMTANVEEGDTFTVNGTPVTAWMGTDEAVGSMAGSEYNGRWVSFIVDGKTLNFKGGGGRVTVEGLTADKVLAGNTVTVKQGAKLITEILGALKPDTFLIARGPKTTDVGLTGQYATSLLAKSSDVEANGNNWKLPLGKYKVFLVGLVKGRGWNDSGYGYEVSFTSEGTKIINNAGTGAVYNPLFFLQDKEFTLSSTGLINAFVKQDSNSVSGMWSVVQIAVVKVG